VWLRFKPDRYDHELSESNPDWRRRTEISTTQASQITVSALAVKRRFRRKGAQKEAFQVSLSFGRGQSNE
jgi:hypothetical protein